MNWGIAMYVAKVDVKVLKTEEMHKLLDLYEETFGERFIAFNYADFHSDGEKCAAQVYKETLQKALNDEKPYHIKSKRYDTFDH